MRSQHQLNQRQQRLQKQNQTTPHVSRIKRILLNETGQMTIFVALIFQVLFVFFAMVINIGLLVHDKINLQNAVDLGAYYGAQRQAEILNEIAHINYQIHQDNKLLAWRFWVLGTLGRDGGSGATPTPGSSDPSTFYSQTDHGAEFPSVCVANLFWAEATVNSSEAENYCFRSFGPAGQITKIPKLPVIAPFVPGIVSGAISISNLQNQQNVTFMDSGPLNWAFAAQMMEAYRMALTSRKAVIQKLRAGLVSDNLMDQSLERVAGGVLQTIKKNLTVSNLASFDDQGFAFKNGLATSRCAGPSGDGSTTISEIRTHPILLYTYPYSDIGGNFLIGQALETDLSHVVDGAGNSALPVYDPNKYLQYFSTSEPSDQIGNDQVAGLNASSLGFEKNPWCMAYVAVHARTSPRKPFAPFGQSVVLEARAFAQPFGGRIGPWYKDHWPVSSLVSTGKRIDPISTPRWLNSSNEDGEDGTANLPNYARFPEDNLGIRSFAAQAAERAFIRGYRTKGSQLSYNFYLGYENVPVTGDPLAWDSQSNDTQKPSARVGNVRRAETLAIAPDLFDVTYYSIDPSYAANYKRLNNGGARFGSLGAMFNKQISVPPDLGGRNGSELEGFRVTDQVEIANSGAGLDPILRNKSLSYVIYDIAHILTGWAPVSATNFDFPESRFATCSHMAKIQYMIPGGCTNGGRTGYSVRILARDHLLSAKWNVGGEGQVGPILNPPDLAF